MRTLPMARAWARIDGARRQHLARRLGLRGFTREAVVLAVTDLEWLAARRAPLGGRGGGFLGMLLRVDAVGLLRGRLFRLRGLHGFFHTGSVSHSRGGVKNFFRSAKHVKAVTMSGRS